MTDQHPITPSPELLQQWVDEFYDSKAAIKPGAGTIYIATQAARWGYERRGAVNEAELQKVRDEELDACCEHIKKWFVAPEYRVAELRAARRPQPKSLKQRALDALTQMESQLDADLTTEIRQALEELPDD